jgi:hypothetical protein
MYLETHSVSNGCMTCIVDLLECEINYYYYYYYYYYYNRPILIIPVFPKLLERLMYNRTTSFLYENKILSEAQNGFSKGKSIDTAVQSHIERIQEAGVNW